MYIKYEALNPGGSIKTRTALNMILDAEQKGKLHPDSVIVEYTSGNQGIGLALVASVLGYKCTIVMPEIMSEERKKTIKAYGAELICTPTDKNITKTFEIAKQTALDLVASDDKYFLAGQFENPANCEAHYKTTSEEIIEQLGDMPLDAFVAAVGTGGTITGTSKRLRKQYPDIKIITVEPESAAILSGGCIGIHKQQGIGDGFIPDILDCNCYDSVITVTDDEAFQMARDLARFEGLLVGISSGTNVFAAIKTAKELPEESNIVTICPDSGERYLSESGMY